MWEAVGGHGRSTDRLLLGVEYADGRGATTAGGPFGSGDRVVLASSSSGGGDRAVSADWYLSPLPPPGELLIHCAWPGAGISETVTSIDAGAILEAAGRVRELWPWEPARERSYKRVRPTVEEGGWFARVMHPEG